jgi:branched-chain amino acid transport system ATP-binding protein
MTNPRVLLLDEVSLGLSPLAVDLVYKSVESLIASGATILLVEQDLKRALKVANKIICMLEGRIVIEGDAKTLTREQITDAYFGHNHKRSQAEKAS